MKNLILLAVVSLIGPSGALAENMAKERTFIETPNVVSKLGDAVKISDSRAASIEELKDAEKKLRKVSELQKKFDENLKAEGLKCFRDEAWLKYYSGGYLRYVSELNQRARETADLVKEYIKIVESDSFQGLPGFNEAKAVEDGQMQKEVCNDDLKIFAWEDERLAEKRAKIFHKIDDQYNKLEELRKKAASYSHAATHDLKLISVSLSCPTYRKYREAVNQASDPAASGFGSAVNLADGLLASAQTLSSENWYYRYTVEEAKKKCGKSK